MDYEKLLSQLSEDDVKSLRSLFTTESKPRFGETYQRPPSYYGSFQDATSVGLREPSDRQGTGYKLQSRSGKTVFADTKAAQVFQDWMRDEHIGTKLLPDVGEDGKLKAMMVQITDAHPSRKYKPGDIVSRIPVTTTPQEGLHPIEMIGNKKYGWWESPMGEKGSFHIGSPISHVAPAGASGQPANLKTPIGQTPGRFDTLQHTLNPLKLANGGLIDKAIKGSNKLI
jgi:hypothetical protein